jgi:hypothetical protein
MYRYMLVNGLSGAGTVAESSWYIDKPRRAYGPQLIPMSAQEETYKSLKADVPYRHAFCKEKSKMRAGKARRLASR